MTATPAAIPAATWDPQMRAAFDLLNGIAASHPPMVMAEPFGRVRAINEAINVPLAEGGPAMADTTERWVAVRGRRVLCRVHRPSTRHPLPALVYFHGGGWVLSSIDTHDRVAREYAASGEVATVIVDYALSPEARFPRALLECADIVRHLAAHGAAWGLDPACLFVGGDSAGGNLALAVALLLRDSGEAHKLRGILAAYPATDLRMQGTPRHSGPEYWLSMDDMRAFRELYLRDAADRLHPLASPLLADCAGLPPTLIQLAELDPLYEEGCAMAERLRQAGVAVTLETTPGVLHGFLRLSRHVEAAARATESGGRWLRAMAGSRK